MHILGDSELSFGQESVLFKFYEGGYPEPRVWMENIIMFLPIRTEEICAFQGAADKLYQAQGDQLTAVPYTNYECQRMS